MPLNHTLFFSPHKCHILVTYPPWQIFKKNISVHSYWKCKAPSLICQCSIFLQSASVAFTHTQWLVIDSSELLCSAKKFILITKRENMKLLWLTQQLKRKSLDESCNLISNYASSASPLTAAAAAAASCQAGHGWCLYGTDRALRIPANKPVWSSSE